MDTIVTAKVVSDGPEVDEALQRALGWFGHVERTCSRFDTASDVYQLASQTGRPVHVDRLLFEAIRFSLELAALTDGLFDPAVGAAQAQRGFDRNYVTGKHISAPAADANVSWRDITLDGERDTITLAKPVLIDLGAVVKGMAIDLAAKELAGFESFCVDAGGDLYVKGRNPEGGPWRVGIEHPRQAGLIATLAVDQGAICTSGDYERKRPGVEHVHHLLDPRTGQSPSDVISCTVVAPTAMAADALSTAAFIAGPKAGLALLEDQSVDGLLVAADLTTHTTAQFERWLA